MIEDTGELLDAKAIIQTAWGHQYPRPAPLPAHDFRGDRTSVAEPLRSVGLWVDDLKGDQLQSDSQVYPGRQSSWSERSTAAEYETTPSTGTVALRLEAILVSRFERYLRSEGHVGGRVRIRVPGETYSLVTDPYDTTTGILYAANSSWDRAPVRLEVGHLLDDLRFVPAACGALLLRQDPSNDLVDVIHSCGFYLIYASGQ